MQPPDSPPPPATPGHEERAPATEFPDDVARTEHQAVSTAFDPGTGQRLKRAAIIAAAVLLVGFVAVRVVRFVHDYGLARSSERANSAPRPVDTVVARPAAAGQGLALPGQTAAWFDTTIYARVNGYVASWLVDIGDHVKKGQLLATIETPELDAELGAAVAQLKASDAQAVARKAEAEFGRTTNERWRDSPKGVVSEQERDAKKADFETSEARLYAATAQVALDKARVDQYSALAQFKQVRAPFDGTITERRIDIGNLVTAGSTSATTPLYRMSQSDPLRVFVDVPQSLAGELMKPGVPAEVQARGVPGGALLGTIARSAEAINAQARTMRVEVDIPNKDHALVPGMYVTVAFRLEPQGLVEVPAAALVFRADGPRVARVGPDSKVEFSKVTIARDDGSMVELASGVAAGDRLVLNISGRIAAGDVVSVTGGSGSAEQAAGAGH
ncbi:MAG TPA: efflux RND transporter periplasmic adaptor subunit [Steroidobacteraceae bacterium]|nr:efflux RND transporter periplasmic adaptor subunit [Steroidobacteraceae bacterium]